MTCKEFKSTTLYENFVFKERVLEMKAGKHPTVKEANNNYHQSEIDRLKVVSLCFIADLNLRFV
jgi:hypothetical protein